MRLESFILNESRSKTIDLERALDLIHTNCGKHVQGLLKGSRPSIYRGTYTNIRGGYALLDPTRGRARISANTSNHMTLLVDNLPSWKNYPKRSKSAICSTSDGYAGNFGNIFYVYPYDKCKIGISAYDDFWEGFSVLTDDVSVFNETLHDKGVSGESYIGLSNDLAQIYDVEILETFKLWAEDGGHGEEEAFDVVMPKYGYSYSQKSEPFYSYVKQLLLTYSKTGKMVKKGTFLKHLNKILDPKKNGFELDNLSMKHKNREVWIGNAPMVMVSTSQYGVLEDDYLI